MTSAESLRDIAERQKREQIYNRNKYDIDKIKEILPSLAEPKSTDYSYQYPYYVSCKTADELSTYFRKEYTDGFNLISASDRDPLSCHLKITCSGANSGLALKYKKIVDANIDREAKVRAQEIIDTINDGKLIPTAQQNLTQKQMWTNEPCALIYKVQDMFRDKRYHHNDIKIVTSHSGNNCGLHLDWA